ncbi:PREDICTED: protein regulator of cytokinesis 1-like [Rhagoletis zephyria]|uniref:protein regulator of cytokinesis 1-like n=1 Tax=Rhagoletis zephyria TaxID=28612 RepID=UPI000811617E|nr:PREDICTED: protein regulator of cytokinesis 1-like [Rhagoletis zephyria]
MENEDWENYNEEDAMLERSFPDTFSEIFSKQLSQAMVSQFREIGNQWLLMGTPVVKRDKKIEELRFSVLDKVSQFLENEKQNLTQLKNYRDYQLNEINNILTALSLKAYELDSNKTLLGQNKALHFKLKELQTIKTERLENLERIETKLKKVYHSLGLDYVPTSFNTPIPSESELSTMRYHLIDQERVLETRKKRYDSTKSMWSQYLRELDYVPEDENEKMFLNLPPNEVIYSQSNLNSITNFYAKITEKYNETKNEIESLKAQLLKLFERLDIEIVDRNKYMSSLQFLNLPAKRESLLAEIKHYELQKKSCLEKIIKKIRDEIDEKLSICMVQKFDDSFIVSNEFTEELLVEHETQFANLNKFQEVYQEVFNKIREWEKGLEELVELEKKLQDPNRFNNRGGVLLQNERDRKALGRKLPKLEKDIRHLITLKEAKEHLPFDTYGLNIDEFIKTNWDHVNNSKNKKSALVTGGGNSSKKSAYTLSSQKKTRVALSPRHNLFNKKAGIQFPTSRRLFNDMIPRSTSVVPPEEEFGKHLSGDKEILHSTLMMNPGAKHPMLNRRLSKSMNSLIQIAEIDRVVTKRNKRPLDL